MEISTASSRDSRCLARTRSCASIRTAKPSTRRRPMWRRSIFAEPRVRRRRLGSPKRVCNERRCVVPGSGTRPRCRSGAHRYCRHPVSRPPHPASAGSAPRKFSGTRDGRSYAYSWHRALSDRRGDILPTELPPAGRRASATTGFARWCSSDSTRRRDTCGSMASGRTRTSARSRSPGIRRIAMRSARRRSATLRCSRRSSIACAAASTLFVERDDGVQPRIVAGDVPLVHAQAIEAAADPPRVEPSKM